ETDVTALERDLERVGAPYTPGRGIGNLLSPQQAYAAVDGGQIQIVSAAADPAAQPAAAHLPGDGDRKVGLDVPIQHLRVELGVEGTRQRQRDPAIHGLEGRA